MTIAYWINIPDKQNCDGEKEKEQKGDLGVLNQALISLPEGSLGENASMACRIKFSDPSKMEVHDLTQNL